MKTETKDEDHDHKDDFDRPRYFPRDSTTGRERQGQRQELNKAGIDKGRAGHLRPSRRAPAAPRPATSPIPTSWCKSILTAYDSDTYPADAEVEGESDPNAEQQPA